MDALQRNCSTQLDCIICDKLQPAKNVITDLFARPTLLKLIIEISGIELKRDHCYPDRICHKCLISTNCRSEIACRFRSALQKKFRQYYGINPPSSRVKTSKANDDRITNGNMIDSDSLHGYRNAYDGPPQHDQQPNDATNADTNSASYSVPKRQRQRKQHFSAITTSPNSLLEPLFIVSEYVSVTESGGNIHQDNDEMTARSLPSKKYTCPMCCKEYVREHNFKLHLRRVCRRIGQRPASTVSGTERQTTSRRYRCRFVDCLEVFGRLGELQEHTRSQHINWYSCSACGRDDIATESEQLWHWASCPVRMQTLVQLDHEAKSEWESSIGASSIRTSISSGKSSIWTHRPRRSDRLEIRRLRESRSEERLPPVPAKRTKTRALSTASRWTSVSGKQSVMSVTSDPKVEMMSLEMRRARCRVRREMKRHMENQGKDTKFFACSISECSVHTLTLYEIMRHEMDVHQMSCLHFCDVCKQWFTTATHFWLHQRANETVDEHICAFCGDVLNTHFALRHHLMEHFHVHNEFACSACPRSFVNFTDLATHRKKVHQQQQGDCNEIRKPFSLIRMRRSNRKNTESMPLRMLDGALIEDSNDIEANIPAANVATPDAMTSARRHLLPAIQIPPSQPLAVQKPIRILLPLYDPNATRNTADIWAGCRKVLLNRSGDYISFRKHPEHPFTTTAPIPVLPPPCPSVLLPKNDRDDRNDDDEGGNANASTEETTSTDVPKKTDTAKETETDAGAVTEAEANVERPSSSGDRRPTVSSPVSVLSEGGWQTDEDDDRNVEKRISQPTLPPGVTIIKTQGSKPMKRNGTWTNEVKSKIRAAESHPAIKRALRKRADSSTERPRDVLPLRNDDDDPNVGMWMWPENRGSSRCRRYALKRQMLCVSPVGPTFQIMQPLSYSDLIMNDRLDRSSICDPIESN